METKLTHWFGIQRFIKQDANGFKCLDKQGIIDYLNWFEGITVKPDSYTGFTFAIGMFHIWPCKHLGDMAFACATLINGSYGDHAYYEYSAKGLEQAIQRCFGREDMKETDEKTYKIIRKFQSLSIPDEPRATGLTLKEAQEHCNDPLSSSKAYTPETDPYQGEKGAWADVFYEE